METEIWKSHPDIVGIEVSTFGNVRTLDRVISSEKGTYFKKGRILKQCNHHGGYLHVGVSIDGKQVTKLVHRLVAQTFLPNPNGFPMVNHRDCNRKNNHVENLEFCTASYNRRYQEKFGKSSSKPIFAINLATLEVSRFPSQGEASRELKIAQGNIGSVIRGERKQTHGFWFVNDDNKATDAIKNKLHKIRKGW